MLKRIPSVLSLMMVFCIGIALAQDAVCPDLVTEALARVDEFCAEAGRNQACYGNVALTAEAQPDVEDFAFEEVGDIVNVADIQTIRVNAMDETGETWGCCATPVTGQYSRYHPRPECDFSTLW